MVLAAGSPRPEPHSSSAPLGCSRRPDAGPAAPPDRRRSAGAGVLGHPPRHALRAAPGAGRPPGLPCPGAGPCSRKPTAACLRRTRDVRPDLLRPARRATRPRRGRQGPFPPPAAYGPAGPRSRARRRGIASQLEGQHGRLRPTLQVELGQQVGHVVPHRLLGQDQALGDLAVGQAVGDEVQDLALTRGQRAQRRLLRGGLPQPVEELAGEGRVEQRPPAATWRTASVRAAPRISFSR